MNGIIKYAATEEDKNRVKEWLLSKGNAAVTNNLFYIEEDGEIKAAVGLTIVPAIEPLMSENKLYTYKLLQYIQGLAKGMGHDLIQAMTNNPKAQTGLIKDGFTVWTPSITQFLKEI